jgi:excisionase family DNA binding protein
MESEVDLLNGSKSDAFATHETESFIDASKAANFVNLNRKTLLRLAREGSIPAHPLSGDKRRVWRFLLSELDLWARGKVNSTCDRCQNSRRK